MTARSYVSPLREAGAAATRGAIVLAAVDVFERLGWSGATMTIVAGQAGVSPKTVQAQFGTKAKLLAGAVDFSVRGQGQGAGRGAAVAIRSAGTAAEALSLHATMITAVNARAAALAAVVEAGAAGDAALAPLWERMRESMRFGVHWAAETINGKPGLREGLSLEAIETVIQIAMAWGTHRTLMVRGMSSEQIEAWIRELYERMLLSTPSAGS